MSDYVNQFSILSDFNERAISSFVILSDIEKRIKEKIENIGIPLKDWDIQINYGIKTGFNEAFIINGKTKDELIDKSSKNAEIIRPILRGRDIKRYGYEFADLWLICTFPSLKLNIEGYPDIKEYLLSFGYDRLKQTGDVGARKKTNNQWFETQDSINYWDVYFVKTKETGDKLVNKDLDFTKTHHIALSYNYKISDDMNLRIEPYFQYLFDVPVIADSSYSVLNRSSFYIEDALINKGKGRNYGIDVTFEKYMTKGMYYMVTASVFNSEYTGGDGVWYNTRFNRNYIINGLFGKEWMIGKNKRDVLSANIKLTVQGGDRYSPVDEQATLAHPDKETQYDESKAYSKQLDPMFIASYTFSYRMNRNKVSHEIAIKGANATGYKEYFGHEYNLKTNIIEPRRLKNSIFNVVYRLDF